MFWEVTNRRKDEKTISYAESHDQALVGDKTIIFRLIDADMYWHFQKGDENYTVHRGIALHKMIRLLTVDETVTVPVQQAQLGTVPHRQYARAGDEMCIRDRPVSARYPHGWRIFLHMPY